MMVALALLCATACGCLVFSAFAAPVIFSMLGSDHALAGRLAGRLFEWSYGCAGGVGLFALALSRVRRDAPRRAAVSLVILAGVQLAVVVPGIVSHGVGWPIPFAALHAAALLVHLGLITCGFWLAWQCLALRPLTHPP